jgi:hypothetical protein
MLKLEYLHGNGPVAHCRLPSLTAIFYCKSRCYDEVFLMASYENATNIHSDTAINAQDSVGSPCI